MERDRYRHSKSHRGPRDRRGEVIMAVRHRKLPAEGYTRGWPEEMTMAEEVVSLVDKRWKEYGL